MTAATFADARLLVFDLDGTLIDSEQDLAASVNGMLTHLRRPTLPRELIRTYIGDGGSMLVRRALGDPEGDPQDEALVATAVAFFLDYYRAHKLDHTVLYPGVLEALTRLRKARPERAMAVLTNKPVGPSREICAGLGIADFFFRIYGGDSFHTKKPAPAGLEALMREAGAICDEKVAITGPQTVMIGDSAVDVLTAHNCGARSIGCTFGLAPATLATVPPDALAHTASEWLELLL